MNADSSGRKSLLRHQKAQQSSRQVPGLFSKGINPTDIINNATGMLDIDTGIDFRSGDTFNSSFKKVY